MDVIQHILAFLNNPMFKIAAAYLGTLILRRWPKFVDEAAPVWTGVVSIVTTLLALMFGVHMQGATAYAPHDSALMLARAAGEQPWWMSLLFNGVLPWLVGYGGQRATGQTVKWAKGEGGTLSETAPTQDKPFQSIKKLE